MDTSQLDPANPWETIADLGAYSLFLGLNYPIMIPVGGADVSLGNLTRSNCVYTSPNAAWLCKMLPAEMYRFSLNGKGDVVCFRMNSLDSAKERARTPLWFISSFTNAMDLNTPEI
jgi:hypothetical protein